MNNFGKAPNITDNLELANRIVDFKHNINFISCFSIFLVRKGSLIAFYFRWTQLQAILKN